MMTKLEAVRELMYDDRNPRPSRTSLKRVRKAGALIGLTAEEQVELELSLGYRNYVTRELEVQFG